MLLRRMLMVLTLCCISGCLTACAHRGASGSASASPDIPGADASRGRQVFAQQCSACHGEDGKGGPVGPALTAERTRKSYEQVRAIVLDPQPPMPKLYPGQMSEADVRDVSAYVETL